MVVETLTQSTQQKDVETLDADRKENRLTTAQGQLGQREYQSAKPFAASVFYENEKSAGVVDGEKPTR